MEKKTIYNNDFYIISSDFRIVNYNKNIQGGKCDINIGDLCYKATMNRDTPCRHCPIAGNNDKDCVIFFDPHYEEWIEAIFSELSDGKYAITRRIVEENSRTTFQWLKEDNLNSALEHYDVDNIGMIGGYCEEGLPLYYVNQRMINMLGYKDREDFERGISGMVINTIHVDDRERVSDEIGKPYYPGMKYETTYRMPKKDGTFLNVIDRGEIIESADGRLVMMCVCLDVTKFYEIQERRERELIAKEANAIKTAFLFNMSHDIRTPMNAIVGFTDLLQKHLDDRELALKYTNKIKSANKFLLSLVNNVLEMARIESGRETVDEVRSNIYDVIYSMNSMFEPQMNEKNLNFVVETDIRHPYILSDETKVKEIMLNIISNAYKYTPSGGKVSVKVIETEIDIPGYALYTTIVEDTGIGMSEEFLPHIFDEFVRERSSTESKVDGTGLGMPIVKKFVDLLQGNIDIESQIGEGTKVTINIRHKILGEKKKESADEKHIDNDIEKLTGKRILLTEDNELNAEIAITVLNEAGFKVEHAEDGVICIDMLINASPEYYDLILMDVQMPHMDGYKATETIRKLKNKKKSEIPIIAMTANAFEEDKKIALDVGMNEHISKPINTDELLSVISSVLKD